MWNLTFSPPGNNWVVNKWGRLSVLRLLQLGWYQGPPYREDVCCVYMRGGAIRWKQINVTPSNIPHLREREREREKAKFHRKEIKLMYTTWWIIYLLFFIMKYLQYLLGRRKYWSVYQSEVLKPGSHLGIRHFPTLKKQGLVYMEPYSLMAALF